MTDGRSLEELRHDIDRIDDSIQELLWQRTAVVERIRAFKHKHRAFRRGGFFRPSREHEVLRRLVRRHRGRFPKSALVQIWRVIIAAHLAHQENFSLAVYRPKSEDGCWDLAREQYGSVVPMTSASSVATVLRKVAERTVSAGVLPVPRKKEDSWWRHLAGRFPDLRIIAGLPFTDFESGSDEVRALIVAPMPAEPTGKDRSFLIVESAGGISPVRLATALTREKVSGRSVLSWRNAAKRQKNLSLIEVDGFLGEEDPVLDRILKRLGRPAQNVYVAGSYAVPLTGAKRKRKRKASNERAKT
ncbi:MAG: chorismate mutase [Alphaproteobacteria bacterium]